MTVKLTGNFLATARCLIYKDGNAITWTFNSNTNELTAAYTGAGSAGSHNPTATIGLTAVNGTAATWMTSDSAPSLSQAIVPTWTGLHTFNAGLTVGGGSFTLSGHTLVLSANATVGGTNTGDQTIPASGNPSASIGLAAVNGVAATFMTSDSAPALSQNITPTWTGAHTFNASVTFRNTASTVSWFGAGAQFGVGIGFVVGQTELLTTGTTPLGSGPSGAAALNFYTTSVNRLAIASGGAATFSGNVGVNGVTPPARVTGWGTPTGGTVVANFAAGATPSLPCRCQKRLRRLFQI